MKKLLLLSLSLGLLTQAAINPLFRITTKSEGWYISQNPDPQFKGITVQLPYATLFRPFEVSPAVGYPFGPTTWLTPGSAERGAKWISVRPDPGGYAANTPPWNQGSAIGLYVYSTTATFPSTCKEGTLELEGRHAVDGPIVFYSLNGIYTLFDVNFDNSAYDTVFMNKTVGVKLVKGLKRGLNYVQVGVWNRGGPHGYLAYLEGSCNQ